MSQQLGRGNLDATKQERLAYVVTGDGELLQDIARKFGARLDAVRKANSHIRAVDTPRRGEVIFIPPIADAEYVRFCEQQPRVGSVAENRKRLMRWSTTATPPAKKAPAKPAAASKAGELLKDCRVSAMLDVIIYAEGTGAGYGTICFGEVMKAPHNPELIGKRNVTITDFSRHPNILVRLRSDAPPKDWSTAAGRYQFLYRTWQGLNMPDFTPRSQDIGVVKKMQERDMIEPLLKDDFAKAVRNGNREWASFPGSPYGQPTKTLAQLEEKYKAALARCQQG